MISELQLQSLAEEMCRHWKIQKRVMVTIDEDHSLINEGEHGICRWWKNPLEVVVLRETTDEGTLHNFYHEMRHCWQSRWYKRVLLWWQAHPSSYEKYYGTYLCEFELDAYVFALQYLHEDWSYVTALEFALKRFQQDLEENS